MPNWILRHQRLINVAAIAAAAIVVLRTALLAIPEPFPWMAEFGELLYDLGLAWVTAWAFQYLVVIRPAKWERERFEGTVAPGVDRLVETGRSLEESIDAYTAVPPRVCITISESQIAKLCLENSVRDEASDWFGTWGAVLRHLGALAETRRASLRPFYAQLPADLLKALDSEEIAMQDILRMEHFCQATNAPSMKRLEEPLNRWLSSISAMRQIRLHAFARGVAPPRALARQEGRLKVPLKDFLSQHEQMQRFLTDGVDDPS